MRKYLLFTVLVAAVLIVWIYPPSPKGATVNDKEVKEAGTFDECVAQGNPVRESYPPVCVTKSGKVMTQNIGNELEMQDKIQVTNPRPTQKIVSPLSLKGTARGGWFFEGQFKASIVDDKGNMLGSGIMTTDGEWMTEDFVPFAGEISFTEPRSEKGKVIFEKDNPSGIPENAEQLIIPVRLK